MNLRVFLAGLAAAVAAFFAGWLLYGILLMGFFEANTQTYEGLIKEQMCFALIFAANLVYGLLVAWVYNVRKGPKSIGKAIVYQCCNWDGNIPGGEPNVFIWI